MIQTPGLRTKGAFRITRPRFRIRHETAMGQFDPMAMINKDVRPKR